MSAFARASLATAGLVMQLIPALVAAQSSGSMAGRQRPKSVCQDSSETGTRRDVSAHDVSPCAGDLVFSLRNRTFLIPDRVVDGLKIQPTLGIRWSPTDALVISLDGQTVDNGGPGLQRGYRVARTVGGAGGSGNFLQETAYSVEARLWRSALGLAQVRFLAATSKGVRSYYAIDTTTGHVTTGNTRGLVPSGALLIDVRSSRGRLSVGPAFVWFPRHNALYLRVLPVDSAFHFGTTAGARVEGSFRATSALSLWARGFLPLSGQNSISRASGRPVRVPAWDAGLALHLNAALDVELFSSNVLGNTGALAFVADREYQAIGTGVIFRPVSRNDWRSAVRGSEEGASRGLASPLSRAAIVAPTSRGATASFSFGGQGALAAIDLSPVESLQLGAYLDNTSGTVDEGELGASLSIRLLDRREGFSLGTTVTGARTNNVLINLLTGRGDEFARRGFRKSGYAFGDESVEEARLYVVTGSVSAQRAFGDAAMLWIAPTIAAVQRRGVQIAGVSAGVTGRLNSSLSFLAEAGADLSNRGNSLTSTGRVHRIPWAAAVVRHVDLGAGHTPLLVRAFVTNRVGDSPFHSLRVRAGGSTTVGAGVSVPSWWTTCSC